MDLIAHHTSSTTEQVLYLEIANGPANLSDEIPIRFLGNGHNAKIIATKSPLPKWAQTLAMAEIVRWRIGTKEFAGKAIKIDESELPNLRVQFEEAFGADKVRSWFPSDIEAFELQPVSPSAAGYRETVRSYFDSIAQAYESRVMNNPLDAALRQVSTDVLLRIFQPGDRILELGAGTGIETLVLASRGIEILATDISNEMINLLEGKVHRAGLDAWVQTRQVAAGDVGCLTSEFGPGAFDGAFSTFGALNTEERLDVIPAQLATLVRADGRVLFGIWNRVCISEIAMSLAVGGTQRAFARLKDPVPVGLSRYGIPVHAHSFGSFVRSFRPFFRVDRVSGVPVFVPPYDFGGIASRHPGLIRILRELDIAWADRFPFNRMGDHFLVELHRR